MGDYGEREYAFSSSDFLACHQPPGQKGVKYVKKYGTLISLK